MSQSLKDVSQLEVKKGLKKWIKRKMLDEDKLSMSDDKSSIMNISQAKSMMRPTAKASAPAKEGGVLFWFKRSDFYVTGLDFVFARIAIVSQSNCIPFYLLEVCGFEGKDLDGDHKADTTPY